MTPLHSQVLAPALEVDPVGHNSQPDPAPFVSLRVDEYLFAGQVHVALAEAEVEVVPLGQGEHDVAPSPEKVLDPQLEQEFSTAVRTAAAYFPAVHFVHPVT